MDVHEILSRLQEKFTIIINEHKNKPEVRIKTDKITINRSEFEELKSEVDKLQEIVDELSVTGDSVETVSRLIISNNRRGIFND